MLQEKSKLQKNRHTAWFHLYKDQTLAEPNHELFRGAHVRLETIEINERKDSHQIQNSSRKITGNALCLNVLKSMFIILSFFKLYVVLHILLYV